MAEEISLSVEETNKIRVSLGLKPIPITKNSEEIPQSSGGVQCLSLAETNKIRLSLGLAPIIIDNLSYSNEKSELNNHEKYNQEVLQNKKDEQLKHRLQEAKERTQKRRKLINGKTLSDASNPAEITEDWLSNLGKPQLKSKQKVQKSKNVQDKEDNDVDMKIAHTQGDLLRLQDNEILTLEDTDVLNDDDEVTLSNDKLVRDNKLKKELREKLIAENIKETGRGRSSTGAEETEDLGSTTGFVKVSNSTIKIDNEEPPEAVEAPTNKIRVDDLFSEINEESSNRSDYSKSKKTTKIKKNKMKNLHKERIDFDLENVILKEVQLDAIDDDQFDRADQELESILSLKRKLKQKSERRKLTPEQIANEVKNAQRWEAENEMENLASASKSNINSRIVYDSTSDFLDSLTGTNAPETAGDNRISVKSGIPDVDSPDLLHPIQELRDEAGVDDVIDEKDNTPTFSKGLASTLNFLRSRDELETRSGERAESERIQREAIKQNELFKIKVSIEERLLRDELQNDKSFKSLPKADRDAKFEALLDSRLQEKNIVLPSIANSVSKKKITPLESYNPEVKLSYRDDVGNELNTKQAFKYLSHQFHGVGPSKKSFQKKKSLSLSESRRIL